MSAMAHWCFRHRRIVLAVWLLIFVGIGVIGRGLGTHYASSFSLPATDSTRALNLLKAEFPAASGESDTIVVHVSKGRVTDPAVRSRIEPMLAKVSKLSHVQAVVSPYSHFGANQTSKDGTTEFASVN